MTQDDLNAIRQIIREELAGLISQKPNKEFNPIQFRRALIDFTHDKEAMNRYCQVYRLPNLGEE